MNIMLCGVTVGLFIGIRCFGDPILVAKLNK